MTSNVVLVGMWSLHSSVSWLGFYSGLFGLLVAAVGFLGISRHAVALMREASEEHAWMVVASSAVLACLLVESFSGNTLFGSPFAYPLAVAMLAVLFSFERSTQSAVV